MPTTLEAQMTRFLAFQAFEAAQSNGNGNTTGIESTPTPKPAPKPIPILMAPRLLQEAVRVMCRLTTGHTTHANKLTLEAANKLLYGYCKTQMGLTETVESYSALETRPVPKKRQTGNRKPAARQVRIVHVNADMTERQANRIFAEAQGLGYQLEAGWTASIVNRGQAGSIIQRLIDGVFPSLLAAHVK